LLVLRLLLQQNPPSTRRNCRAGSPFSTVRHSRYWRRAEYMHGRWLPKRERPGRNFQTMAAVPSAGWKQVLL